MVDEIVFSHTCEMIKLCECGENQTCAVCGLGFGCVPCTCQRERIQIKEELK